MAVIESRPPDPVPPLRQLWFLDTRVAVRVSYEDGTDRISVLEHWAPYGDSPPLHLHIREDEVFHILEGSMRFRIADAECDGVAGQTLIAPKGVPHTYRVESESGARWLTVTTGGDFERLVRAFSRAAERDGLPEPAGAPPSPADAETLAAACRDYGIELLGPPLS
jgi:mannose-6-phosphate isomerase-like protein (cupin superfamily)